MKKIYCVIIFFCTTFSISAQLNRSAVNTDLFPFYHGVASGDPLTDQVIIWTRITPNTATANDIPVKWRIATDTGMTNIINSGTFLTNINRDYTVKIDVDQLSPNTTYYYDFLAFDSYSKRGRTKTLPENEVDEMRFGVVSCSSYEHGYFNAYQALSKRNDIDAIICLGDYIYEYEVGGYSNNLEDRQYEPSNEIISLDDYRVRYSHYRLDKDLQDAHQQYPWMCIWDDHETADNSYTDGAVNHNEGEGDWEVRKASALKAYAEWMPVRQPTFTDQQVYHKVTIGNLLSIYFLDTRLAGRDEQLQVIDPNFNSENRRLLGLPQLDWLITEMANSTTKWNVVAQQVMMAPLSVNGIAVNTDQWDGYPAERDRLYDAWIENNIQNIVVLTGDIHTSWGNELPKSFNLLGQYESMGVEFVVTSITSPGLIDNDVATLAIQTGNPHIKYADLFQHGYMVLDVRHDKVQNDWYYVNTIETKDETNFFGKGLSTASRSNILSDETNAAVTTKQASLFAPDYPYTPQDTTSTNIQDKQAIVVLGMYPNPTTGKVLIPYQQTIMLGKLELKVMDSSGQVIMSDIIKPSSGVQYMELDFSSQPAGVYIIQIASDSHLKTLRLIKR